MKHFFENLTTSTVGNKNQRGTKYKLLYNISLFYSLKKRKINFEYHMAIQKPTTR